MPKPKFNWLRSCRCGASRRSASSCFPLRTHCWNLRWRVWKGGYFSGSSRQCAPVPNTHSTPWSTARVSCHGRAYRPGAAVATPVPPLPIVRRSTPNGHASAPSEISRASQRTRHVCWCWGEQPTESLGESNHCRAFRWAISCNPALMALRPRSHWPRN